MDDQNKNLILATALSFLVILVWFVLFPPEPSAVDPNAPDAGGSPTATTSVSPPAANTTDTQTATTASTDGSAAALSETARVTIQTPKLSGSISLLGGRIDDLLLNDYRETLDEGSPNVTLLSPVGQPEA